ncbi:MAG: MarR family transcriptional regulator [Actinomycetota bacterium]|nr:MarR family transcriptional regulator [Actinomycetota bacterium]MDA3020919.1 MarR family transcriptional regulator [Actinomycetota bacterium]
MPRLDAERVALWRAFQTAGEVVSRSIEAEMFDEFHLALPQFDLLAALAQNNDQMRVKELCEILSAVPSSLSRRIDSLVEREYVTREEAPTVEDNRAVIVRLTRMGRLVWRDSNILYRRAIQREFASGLTETEVSTMVRALTKVSPFKK